MDDSWLDDLPTYEFAIATVLPIAHRNNNLAQRIENAVNPQDIDDFLHDNGRVSKLDATAKLVIQKLEKQGQKMKSQKTSAIKKPLPSQAYKSPEALPRSNSKLSTVSSTSDYSRSSNATLLPKAASQLSLASPSKSPFKTPERPWLKKQISHHKKPPVNIHFDDGLMEFHKALKLGIERYPLEDYFKRVKLSPSKSDSGRVTPTSNTTPVKDTQTVPSPKSLLEISTSKAAYKLNFMEQSPNIKTNPADIDATPHKKYRRFQRLNEQFIKYETHSLGSVSAIETVKAFRTPMSPMVKKSEPEIPSSSIHLKNNNTRRNLNLGFAEVKRSNSQLDAVRKNSRQLARRTVV